MEVLAGGQLWRYSLEDLQFSDQGRLPWATLAVHHSTGVTIWTWFMMIVMWALALGVISIAILKLWRRMAFQFGVLTWMAAMLFTISGFRNAAPGSPPIGSIFDCASFFWAEGIVACGLMLTIFVVFRDRNRRAADVKAGAAGKTKSKRASEEDEEEK